MKALWLQDSIAHQAPQNHERWQVHDLQIIYEYTGSFAIPKAFRSSDSVSYEELLALLLSRY